MELQKVKKNLGFQTGLHEATTDQTDGLPNVLSFSWFDVVALILSIISFLVDIGTDIIVAKIHYENGHMWYFSLTVAFVAVPALVMSSFNVYWYVTDMEMMKHDELYKQPQEKVSTKRWTVRIVLLILQFGPVLRYVDSLLYGIQSSRNKANPIEQRRLYELMIFEDLDATMLRLFECFMEAAPQLLLQLYIIVRNYQSYNDYGKVLFQAATVMMSLTSLAWSLVSYQRSLRLALPLKGRLTWPGTIVYFLWRFFIIAARVSALALFASIFPLYLCIVCVVHWGIMFSWILYMKTEFCSNRLAEIAYNAIIAIIFIFCYFNPVDSPTRFRILAYYLLCLIENSFLIAVWYIYATHIKVSYCIAIIISHYISFFFGIIFMVMYYLLFHPSGNIPLWRSCGHMNSHISIELKEKTMSQYNHQTGCEEVVQG